MEEAIIATNYQPRSKGKKSMVIRKLIKNNNNNLKKGGGGLNKHPFVCFTYCSIRGFTYCSIRVLYIL